MKRLIKSLVCVTVLLCMAVPAWAQSTQGKEFWVSSSIVCSPSDGKGIEPYIAVSAEKACTVTITGGVGNAFNISQKVAAGSWNEFGHNSKTEQTDPNAGLVYVNMDASKWYPINTKRPSSVSGLAGQKFMYGLHITATENISVYVILGGESSMDASNILPITALGSEYYVQDYKPRAHNKESWNDNEGNMVTVTTILGTEDGTIVDIIPNGDTFDNHASGTPYDITLNQGQIYYLMSKKEQQLAGTHIKARDNRKIAVYTGSPLTTLPNEVSARDALFEQPLPTEYWGTQFVVTRSLGKNGNVIGITAMNDQTEVKLNGHSQNPKLLLSEGETYYIALQNDGNPYQKKGDNNVDMTINGDALYIETSCPCAVYNYDTGSSFVGDGKDAAGNKIDEIEKGPNNKPKGDPSSVWVSPVQQKIGKITFGTCYTAKTEDHFLNIVAETAHCNQTKLTALYGKQTSDKTSLLVWKQVPGNTAYSYARAQIGTAATKQFSVFRLENPKGFIATVYGNGENESYAYSAGSAAVELGVDVNGETFTNDLISDTRFCMGTSMDFDASVGGKYEVTRVDWNFGDGISEYNSTPQISHDYTVPGWYDVEADLYGKQVCTDESNQWLGKVQFSFRVVRPDTIRRQYKECLAEGSEVPASVTTITEIGCDTIIITDTIYALESSSRYQYTAKDEYIIDGERYTDPYQEVKWYAGKNAQRCDSFRTCELTILECLNIEIPNDPASQFVCQGRAYDLQYSSTRGIIGETHFICGDIDTIVQPYNGYFSLPTAKLKPNKYKALITVEDTVCDQHLEFPIDFTVYYYPDSIFAYKFDNVLAVYTKEYNGGYDFIEYQWYYNGQPIPGANTSVYHTEEPLETGEYSVMLKRSDGVEMPTCSKHIEKSTDFRKAPDARATKHLVNHRIVIRKGDETYNIYGQRVE